MITKTQFCRCILNESKLQLISDGRYSDSPSDEELINHVLESTRLGIALEFLGILTEESHKELFYYIQSRTGIEQSYIDKESCIHVLTTREMIDLLPD